MPQMAGRAGRPLFHKLSAEDESPSQDRGSEEEERGGEPGVTHEPTASTRLSAWEIYHNVRIAAEEELKRPPSALFWSALAAGLTIGFSFLAAAYLTSLAPPHLQQAALAVGYPVGFIFVVLARNQLFTENTLEPIIPLLHSPGRDMLRRLLELWGIVLIGNLLGAAVFGLLVAKTPMFGIAGFHSTLRDVAELETRGGFGTVFYQAIFGGWLIALMAWLLASTRSTGAQVVLVWLATAPIAAFGFRHSIAGAVSAFYRAWSGAAGWDEMVARFLVAAVLGNIVGGVLLVALINHGQITAGRGPERRLRP
jgi:formate/nitrite transporter FocA (FNT family)